MKKNLYVEIKNKDGKLTRRLNLTFLGDDGKDFVMKSVKSKGFTVSKVESDEELETGNII